MKAKLRPPAELSMFCVELKEIQHAGLSLADGLQTLCGDDPAFAEVCRAADEGATLPEALRLAGGFPKYMLDMLDLADQTGRQEETLDALAAYYDRRDRMRVSIRSAVLYPVILTAIMLAVIVVLVTQVLPIFSRVFAQLGMQMTGFAAGMLQFGQWLSGASAAIGLALALVLLAAVVIWKAPSAKQTAEQLFRRVCGGRGVWARIASARFTAAMAMATGSGMDVEQAAISAAAVCEGDARTNARLAQCIARLQEGAHLGEAMEGVLSSRNCRLVALSERTGSQAEVFSEIARRSEQAVEDELDRLIGWIEPALVILTAVVVGVILLSVMLPLLGIMSTIG